MIGRYLARVIRLREEAEARRVARDPNDPARALLDTAKALHPRIPLCAECGLRLGPDERGWMHRRCAELLELARAGSSVEA